MLLDTHAWIWAANDDSRRLGVKARRAIGRASRAGDLYVSSASIFEIAALATAGRLLLNQSAERWIRASIDRGALRVLNIGIDAALDAGTIPASALADPIDRLLVATARENQIPLLTRDRIILDYAKRTGLVRVVDAAA